MGQRAGSMAATTRQILDRVEEDELRHIHQLFKSLARLSKGPGPLPTDPPKSHTQDDRRN